jgi:prepilin-type N-terminal cleavage/methylation domain-containing protein
MIARVRVRLAASDGYTLSEMLVVLTILLVVVGALTQLFVSGSKAEADMNNRFRAQQNARLALDGLRREIHCASAVGGTTASITITLGAYCPSNNTGTTASFTWCTKDRAGNLPPGAGAPYSLWRYDGTSCSGTGRRWADYLTTATVFASPAPAAGNLATLSVDLPVDLTPSDGKQLYRLQDDIVLRNTTRP